MVLGFAALANAQAATPTKIAIISVQNAILSTKDGRAAAESLQVTFNPRKVELEKKQQQITALQDRLKEFWDWLSQVSLGLVLRRNLTIMLLGADGEPALLWDCRRAFPVRWSGPDLDAAGPVTAFETIELTHSGISRAKGRA